MKTIYNPRYIEIVARLRSAREAAGLSQAEVAQRMGRPQPFIAKIETHERRLDLLETLELCRVLGTSLEAILPEDLRFLARGDEREDSVDG